MSEEAFDIAFLAGDEAANGVARSAEERRERAAEAGAGEGGGWIGQIMIGSFRQRFLADGTFWTRQQYRHQWVLAASQVLAGDRAALITSMTDPAHTNFIRWWVLHREGSVVHLQEQLLFLDALAVAFEPDATSRFVRDRETLSETGEPISEWATSVDAVSAFVARASDSLNR